MALILSIETSTKVCSIALHNKGELLTCKESFVPNSHSELINIFIEEVLVESKIDINQLDAICISSGPGSYTGLRIGTSTAKGMCYALEVPLISIKTLHGLALQNTILNTQFSSSNAQLPILLCPMLDARRMEVYCATFNEDGDCISKTEAKIIEEDSFIETLKENKMLFFGDGAVKCKELIINKNAVFIDDINPSAKSFGEYAYLKYQDENFEDVAYFEPFYLKEFHTIPSKKDVLFGKQKR